MTSIFRRRGEKGPAPPPYSQRVPITEDECSGELGYDYSTAKKYTILAVVFLVQISMNLNTALYCNGMHGMSHEFGISIPTAVWGAAIFLIAYAFGCELWAPWSEECGRKWVLQSSLGLVNVFAAMVGLAPNFATVLAGRFLGGLATAGGSVTLGMVADMFESDAQGHAVAFVVFSSVGGSILGPIIGGFVEVHLNWRWTAWIQLIFGGAVQLLHLVTVPETRTTCMMDKIARRRRRNGVAGFQNKFGPNEMVPFRQRFRTSELIETWKRPFLMFVTEPIVLTLSLLSGFADALIFMQIQSFGLVYKQWGFGPIQIGLAFLSIGLGYVIAWLSFIPAINRNKRQREKHPDNEKAQYESRLWWLLYTAPCLPIGLLIFAMTASGPPIHWIFSMIGAMIIGIANYAIYMATIDYMVAAYGPYAASATGGNGWARDILAGILTPVAVPFYTNILPPDNIRNASIILFAISVVLVAFVFWIYYYGPVLRKKSSFAQKLVQAPAPAAMPTAAITNEAQGLVNETPAQPSHPGPVNQPAYWADGAVFSPNRSSYASSLRAEARVRSATTSPVVSRRNSLEEGGKGLNQRVLSRVAESGSNRA